MFIYKFCFGSDSDKNAAFLTDEECSMDLMREITVMTTTAYRYNLYGSIEDFDYYLAFFANMATYGENDAVVLYINSPGGSIDVGLSIISSINACQAPVTAIVEAPSFSMASVIALACDNLVFMENTYLMFHNYSIGHSGKGAEFMLNTAHNDEHINRVFVMHCSPFLTKAELKRIRNDGDVYIKDSDDTLSKRMERHFKPRK